MRCRIRILDKSILRVQESGDDWDDIAAVNKIVEYDLGR